MSWVVVRRWWRKASLSAERARQARAVASFALRPRRGAISAGPLFSISVYHMMVCHLSGSKMEGDSHVRVLEVSEGSPVARGGGPGLLLVRGRDLVGVGFPIPSDELQPHTPHDREDVGTEGEVGAPTLLKGLEHPWERLGDDVVDIVRNRRAFYSHVRGRCLVAFEWGPRAVSSPPRTAAIGSVSLEFVIQRPIEASPMA